MRRNIVGLSITSRPGDERALQWDWADKGRAQGWFKHAGNAITDGGFDSWIGQRTRDKKPIARLHEEPGIECIQQTDICTGEPRDLHIPVGVKLSLNARISEHRPPVCHG